MNLCLIIGTFYPATYYGGPIYSTYYLSKGLSRLGVTIKVSTTNANGDSKLDVTTGTYLQLEPDFLVKYYGWATRKSFSLPYLFGLFRDIRSCDLVFLQPIFSSYVPVSLLYAYLLSKPVLLSPRGSLGNWCMIKNNIFKKFWLKILINPFMKNGAWHSTSPEETDNILRNFPAAKVLCISNGVSLDEFDSPATLTKKEYLKKYVNAEIDCDYIVISMGRLHEVKGFDILIRSFCEVRKKLNAVLLIAGSDAGERENLIRLIDELHLTKRVFLVGEVHGQDKTDFLRNADVFALASHHENFGNVYLEALAAGIPVVASTNTPWSEVEREGCGRFVNAAPESFAKAIEEILRANAGEMGLRGRSFVINNFGWERIARQFKDLFDALLERAAI